MQKKVFWWEFGPFLLKFGQKLFSRKKGFKYSNYLPSCQKSEKTLELMDGQADRQTDCSDFIGPSTI